jgi:hypothetical protein
MAKNDIPADLRRFILTSIPSVPHIEALMLLRSHAPEAWSPPDVARRLYVAPEVAESVLADLCKAGILLCDHQAKTYAYRSGDELIERLAELYASNLVEVTMLIHSKLDRKAQQFADAFNFRKEP